MFTADYKLNNGAQNHLEDTGLDNLYFRMQNEWDGYWIGDRGPQVVSLTIKDAEGNTIVER